MSLNCVFRFRLQRPILEFRTTYFATNRNAITLYIIVKILNFKVKKVTKSVFSYLHSSSRSKSHRLQKAEFTSSRVLTLALKLLRLQFLFLLFGIYLFLTAAIFVFRSCGIYTFRQPMFISDSQCSFQTAHSIDFGLNLNGPHHMAGTQQKIML